MKMLDSVAAGVHRYSLTTRDTGGVYEHSCQDDYISVLIIKDNLRKNSNRNKAVVQKKKIELKVILPPPNSCKHFNRCQKLPLNTSNMHQVSFYRQGYEIIYSLVQVTELIKQLNMYLPRKY